MIRLKRKTDEKFIHSLIRTELIPLALKTFPEMKYEKKDINKRLARGRTYIYTMPGSLTPQGFIHTFRRGTLYYIDLLVVRKSARNKGIGSKLMKKADSMAIQKKCTKSLLYVDVINEKAKKFYFKHGYQVEKFEQPINCLLLSKPIGKRQS